MALELSGIFETPRDVVRSKLHGMARWSLRLLAAIEHHLEKRRSRRTLWNSPTTSFLMSV